MKSAFLSLVFGLTLLTSSFVEAQTTGTVHSKNQKMMDILSGNYEVDNAHTRVSFSIPHFVFSEVEGRFNDISGKFTIGTSIIDSKFEASSKVSSIDTGIKQRDDHLKSADFFDASKYPEIKFESKSITGTYDNFKMVASVTIKGVTKDVLFSGAYRGGVIKDSFGKQRVGIKATGKINRRDFNINYDGKFDLGAVVGDIVDITIITEGIKI